MLQGLDHRYRIFKAHAPGALDQDGVAGHKQLRQAGEQLLLGRGEESSGGRNRPSILADCVEAVIAAVYLDGGMEPARRIIDTFILSKLDGDAGALMRDWKTELQEIIQQRPGRNLSYQIYGESGPDHMKRFLAAVQCNDTVIGTGEGRTKKEAEQMAARAAMLAMDRS